MRYFIASLIFVVHPLHSEAVANIKSLGEGLFISDLNNSVYTIQLKNNGTIKSAEIIDLQGRIISQIESNNQNIKLDMSDFSSGLYIVKIIDSQNQLYQTKLLK